MKVSNMKSNRGTTVPNQFIVTDEYGTGERYFQSYSTVIAKISLKGQVTLDGEWNYSRTTAKYRNRFLGETTKETQRKIDSGEYILSDLN